MIKDTDSFQKAVAEGRLEEAAEWLEKAKNQPNYDARWLDHRSYELMRAFWEQKDFENAYKFACYARTEEGRIGRKRRTDELKAEHEN